MAFSRASSTVASASTPIMSGRGTITSRTTVSPNSKIEWIRRRSSRSASAQPIQPAGHSNLWTLNATGPVWIPKVFNGRNKVFFSFNYNAEKDAKPEEIKAKLAALRDAREKAKKDMTQAQADLRELLTQRQEAVMVMMGFLD